NTRCGGESLKRKCCRRSKNSESASFHSALLVEASSRERLTRTPRSTAQTSATSSHASRQRLEKRIRLWLICLAVSQSERRRRPLKSRSPGCLHRSLGSCRFLAPRSCTAWRRTSERLMWSLHPTTYAKSKRSPQRSMCKVLGIPKRWSEGRVSEDVSSGCIQ